MPWSDVLGQDRATSVLKNAVASGHVAHAYLFHGSEGEGTYAAALALAQALLCSGGGDDGDPCGSCEVCSRVRRSLHPDVHVLLPYPRGRGGKDERPDDYAERLVRLAENPYGPYSYRHRASLDSGEPSRKIVEHRIRTTKEVLPQIIQYAPQEGEYKVVIVPDADHMRTEAANAFLKNLEEPRSDIVFILTVERPDRVLPTILSRCQPVRFDPLDDETIEGALVSEQGLPPDRARFISRLADGSYLRALELIEDEALSELRDTALEFMREAYKGNPLTLLPLVEETAKLGRERLRTLLDLMAGWVRDLLLSKERGAEARLINADQAEAVKGFVDNLPGADLETMVRLIEEAATLLGRNVHGRLLLSTLAIRLGEAMRAEPARGLFLSLDEAGPTVGVA